MSRKSVRIAFDAEYLRELMAGRESWTERAQKYGVSKQAVNGWLSDGRIPPRAMVEIVRDLDLSPDQVERLLYKPQSDRPKRVVITATIEIVEHDE